MKIALAQINTTAGDIEGNLKKAVRYLKKAQELNCDLVIFPESILTGYPAYDLWLKKEIIDKNLTALKNLAREVKETACLVGYIDYNKSGTGKPLLNSAAFIHKGKIIAKRVKTLLPTYDVFDEHRYFEPAKENKIINFEGFRIGITICEDIWSEHLTSPHKLYRTNPVENLFLQKPDFILNLSASPYYVSKPDYRYKLVKTLARKYSIGFFYCNSIGATDELIFDGNSFATDKNGNLLARGKSFKEDLIIADIPAINPSLKWQKQNSVEELADALTLGTRDFVRKSGFAKAVIGLSGGIDSAVVTAIAVNALGKKNVTAIFMPSPYTTSKSTKSTAEFAKNLGIQLLCLPITDLMKYYGKLLKPLFKNIPKDTTEENLQARIRANLLMAYSNKFYTMVLSTGNKSELATGYCTLYGDTCGALAVLADATKRQVYELADFFNRKKETIPQYIITRPPSAELKPAQKDLDTLPSYDELDEIVKLYIEQNKTAAEIIKKGFFKSTVLRVLKKIDKAEFKRRQAPPALKISPKAFGQGRKIPLACKYN